MEIFKKLEPTEEELKEKRRQANLCGIAQDVIELLGKGAPAEDIKKLFGKGFAEDFEEGQNIRDKIIKGLKGISDSELQTIIMRIETRKDYYKEKELKK